MAEDDKADRGSDKEPADRKADGEEEAGANSGKGGEADDGAKPTDEDHKDDNDNDDEDEENEKSGRPSPLQRPWVRALLVVAGIVGLIVLIVWLIGYLNHGRYQQSTNDAYLDADQINISSRATGYVTAVLVDDNQNVRAGQRLVTIQSDNYAADLEKDRAQIAQSQAKVGEVLAQIHQQRAKIDKARAKLAQDEAQVRQYAESYRFDASQARRYTPLAAVGAETQEKAAQYRSQADQSAAKLRSARDQAAASAWDLTYERRQIKVLQAQLESAHAQVLQGQAQYDSDNVDYESTSVISRIDGRVGDRTVRIGQYIQAGTRMMTIVPVAQMYVRANFKETQIGLMRVGQPATITVDALGSETLHGTVASFSPGTGAQFALAPKDNSTGNFTKIVQRVPVKIRLDAGQEARKVLVPGLSVAVSIDTVGAKEDKQAQKDESKNNEDRREQQDKRQTQRDRQSHAAGAGRE